MMTRQFERTIQVIGEDLFDQFSNLKIIVFGVGGVGSAAIEGLVRMGLKEITIVDYDRIDISNLNRQIFTTRDNVGMFKVLAERDRLLSINPDLRVKYYIKKIDMDSICLFDLDDYDYVVDAIDMVTAKIGLIDYCYKNKIKIFSSMGTGNKVDASNLKPMDLYKTNYDPLAKVMRRELKKRRVNKLKVISSTEVPLVKSKRRQGASKSTPGSMSYVPPISGYLMASEIFNDFLKRS